MSETRRLPLEGIVVAEFAHMVMGPACGMILADLGAEVIKIEPPDGEQTRQLRGSGAGFFPTFNRNKKSIALDLKHPEGRAAARQIVSQVDIVVENFRPGVMEELGLDYESLKAANPRLIYVSHKGYLPGPYEKRSALDEIVQMLSGLAYMTGPEGSPLRAGSSVNDIMGGMFGVIGALSALRERDVTGQGQLVLSGLFENSAFLVAQHILQYAVTGTPAAPMPNRVSAWSVYDVFTLAGGEQMFLGLVSDAQWRTFCAAFDFAEFLSDPTLETNNQRVEQRDRLMPAIRERLAEVTREDAERIFESLGLPFAPIGRPQDLPDNPHLRASGALATIRPIPGGPTEAVTPILPLIMDGERPSIRLQPPGVGEHTRELMSRFGFDEKAFKSLRERGIVV